MSVQGTQLLFTWNVDRHSSKNFFVLKIGDLASITRSLLVPCYLPKRLVSIDTLMFLSSTIERHWEPASSVLALSLWLWVFGNCILLLLVRVSRIKLYANKHWLCDWISVDQPIMLSLPAKTFCTSSQKPLPPYLWPCMSQHARGRSLRHQFAKSHYFRPTVFNQKLPRFRSIRTWTKVSQDEVCNHRRRRPL